MSVESWRSSSEKNGIVYFPLVNGRRSSLIWSGRLDSSEDPRVGDICSALRLENSGLVIDPAKEADRRQQRIDKAAGNAAFNGQDSATKVDVIVVMPAEGPTEAIPIGVETDIGQSAD